MKLHVVSDKHLQSETRVYELILGAVDVLKATHPEVAASLYSEAVDGLERVASATEHVLEESKSCPGECGSCGCE